ncbi:MAG: hypothetical protein RR205_02735, partial [Oscillospiraceae bacterium]
ISANNAITSTELVTLRDWIEDNNYLSGSYPYDEVNSIVTEVKAAITDFKFSTSNQYRFML